MPKQETESPGYYATIPANVRYSKIPDGAKLLYGEITSLCNKRGYCWATNKYFADLYGKDSGTISRWIQALRGGRFIVTEANESEGNKRKIYLAHAYPPLGKNAETPLGKNAEHMKTYGN